MGVSIIIVNYNVAEEVKNCINSIAEYFCDIPYEIIVVDNNSNDRTIEKLRNIYSNLRLECLDKNLGYSKANNYGAEISKYEYLLFLNPDTLFIEDFLSTLIKFVNNNNGVGACAPMLVYKDLTFQNSFGPKLGVVYEFAEAFLFINLYRKILKLCYKNNLNDNKPFSVNWMSGACLFIRKNIFINVGGFNPNYFLNYEDIDLCDKIENAGYMNLYFPMLKCIHFDQSSQKKNYEKLVFSRYQSRLIYGKSHYTFIKRYLVNTVHVFGLVLRLILVSILYREIEKIQRKAGYKKAMGLYFGRIKE